MGEQRLAIVVADLMFQSRVELAGRAAGMTVLVTDTPQRIDDALAAGVEAVVVDLHIAGVDAEDVVRRAKAAGARVLAFGRHTEPATLRSARDAGADSVVPRSQLAEELPALLAALLA